MVACLENCSFLAFYKPLSIFFIEKEGFRAAYHYRITKPCSTDLGRCRTTAVPYTVDLVDLTIFKFDFSGSSHPSVLWVTSTSTYTLRRSSSILTPHNSSYWQPAYQNGDSHPMACQKL